MKIELTDGDIEIIKAIKSKHKAQADINDQINAIWHKNNMFVKNPKEADENGDLKALNYESVLLTMKITALNEALVERILGKVS